MVLGMAVALLQAAGQVRIVGNDTHTTTVPQYVTDRITISFGV